MNDPTEPDTLQEQRQLLAVSQRLGRLILSLDEPEQLLDALAKQLIDDDIFDNLGVVLVNGKTQKVEPALRFVRKSAGESPDPPSPASFPGYRAADQQKAEEVAQSGKTVILEAKSNDDPSSDGMGNRRQKKVCFYTPIKQKERVLAVLITDCLPGEKQSMIERLERLDPLIDQLAIGLMHSELNRKFEETQTYLIRSDKMASLGELAAGVAHEINNPVGFVTSNLETLTDYIDTLMKLQSLYQEMEKGVQQSDAAACQDALWQIAELRRQEDIDFILDDIGDLLRESSGGMVRICEIIQSLKRFARQDGLELEVCDLKESIEETLRIVWNELKYKGLVKKQFADMPPIRCHPGQLKQVFINLINNALQAIPDKGEISIETEGAKDYAIVHIADTGTGIPPEVLPRIFESFFTTKPQGKGTGLGLSISSQIIQAHKGRLEVESQVGKGTRFTIKLPWDPDAVSR